MDAIQNEYPSLDMCLSHPTPQGYYHYHSWSPCIKGSGSKEVAPGACADNEKCSNKEFFDLTLDLAYKDKANYGGIIGVAKDGHLIVGPYNENGELWACNEHDVCNGTFLDDGSYAYVSTTTFPYVVGCFGPAAY